MNKRLSYRVLRAVISFALLSITGYSISAAERIESEKKAIAYIEKIEGQIEIDRHSPDKPVVGVDLVGCKVPDDALSRLRVFGKLQRLKLSQGTVSDGALASLKD